MRQTAIPPAAAPSVRVSASTRAGEALERLQAKRGPVVFVQSAQCAGCGEPGCFRVADFHPAVTDVMVGEVFGCQLWLDVRMLQVWPGHHVVLDIERGYSAAPSLSAGDGQHFVVRFVDESAQD